MIRRPGFLRGTPESNASLMDALSDVLRVVRLSGAVYLNAEFTSPWCTESPKDAALCAFTQSASHVLASGIARAIVEQTPTKIFFPNPDADPVEYMEGFSLTEREFRLVKHELEPGSRSFLVKQNHVSVVARLDLQGFDFELDVISGRTANVELMKRVVAEHGDDPARWLPAFRAALQARRGAAHTPTITAKETVHA